MLKKKKTKILNDFYHPSNRNTLTVRDYPLQSAEINKKIKFKTTRRKFIYKKI